MSILNASNETSSWTICFVDDEVKRYILVEEVANDIKALVTKYPVVDPMAMGFQRDWQNEPLWQ